MDNKILKIVIAVITVIYVVSPIDLVPDITPVIGYLDDIIAIYLCCKNILEKNNK